MSEIKIKCIDQCLHLVETPPIFSGDVNYDTVYFEFDSAWDKMTTKSVVFYRSRENSEYFLLDEFNRRIIPKEFMSEKGTLYIGVVGNNDEEIITSQVIAYRIGEGSIVENPPVPTPDIFEQILMDYDDMKKSQEEYQTDWNRQVDDYRKQWDANVTQSINDAMQARNMCLDAVASLQVDITDMNGGTPGTETTAYEYDINGGYPPVTIN